MAETSRYIVAVEIDVESSEPIDELEAAARGWRAITNLVTPVVKVSRMDLTAPIGASLTQLGSSVEVEQYWPGRWRRYTG